MSTLVIRDKATELCHQVAEIFSASHPEAQFEFGEEGLGHERFAPNGKQPPTWRWRWELEGGHICVEMCLTGKGPYCQSHRFNGDDYSHDPGRYVFWNWPETYCSTQASQLQAVTDKLSRLYKAASGGPEV